MEVQKFILDDLEEAEITVGLLRLAKDIADYEFFFHTNRINSFCFCRVDDLVVHGAYYDFFFPVFEGYSKDSKTCYRFIGNKSTESIQKKEITELFAEEQNIKLLLNNQPDIDYIITTSDNIADFSLILLPENLAFAIQEYPVTSESEFFHIIQYYE